LLAPSPLDVVQPQSTFSASGAAAIGFGIENVDSASRSAAYAVTGASPSRLRRPLEIRGAQRTLALAFSGPTLVALVGSSARGHACCSSVDVAKTPGSGGFGAKRSLVGGLLGAPVASLVALPGRLLGAIATERGVWVSQTGRGGRFGAARRLTASTAVVQALDATPLAGAQSAVAWAASAADLGLPGASTPPGANTIFIATGSVQRAPRAARAVITVPSGHWIDELAVAANRRQPTVAWIESWYDSSGLYHSQVEFADVGRTALPVAVSAPDELASGIAFASDADGDQALVWKACTLLGTCALRDALRAAGGRFAPVQSVGPVDGSQAPAVAISPTGQTLVTWIEHGHVLGASAPRGAADLSAPHVVSATSYAADVSLAFGPRGQALATWTQGTLAQSVVGAVYTAK
jgi:hypothetical protein